MVIHVIPGDAYVGTFKETGITGEIVVCRECLVDGPINSGSLNEFWQMRARFLYPDDPSKYLESTVPAFNKLAAANEDDQVNLWFEYELFCQVNMWFCLSLLENTGAEVYRVAPVTLPVANRWEGFARSTAEDLESCFGARTKFSAEDIALGAGLWEAFKNNDPDKLRSLSTHRSACFPYLDEVCEAAIQKDTEPARLLSDILMSGETDFGRIFASFRELAGVYGYGDTQVKRLLESL